MSVVVRSMDRPELWRALASIQAQQAPGVSAEIVVVVACGARHRPLTPLAGPFQARLVRARSALNRPQAANAGLDSTRGRYITFLDDDDELLPVHFAKMMGTFAAAADAEFVHARSIAVDRTGKPLYVYGGPWIPWRQLSHGFFQLAGVMFSRQLLGRGVRFDEQLEILEDLEFFVQCAQVARFQYQPEPVSRYYPELGTSGTGDGPNRNQERIQRALSYIAEKWRELAARLEDLTPARLSRAQEQLQRGRFADAVETLEPILARQPRDVNALNLIGLAQLHLGRFEAAHGSLCRALEILPDHPGISANLALLESRSLNTGLRRVDKVAHPAKEAYFAVNAPE